MEKKIKRNKIYLVQTNNNTLTIRAINMENACILAMAQDIEKGYEKTYILDIRRKNEKDKETPYLTKSRTKLLIEKKYNPNYGDDRICKCGHSYYRHFDSWDNMYACGCKYCGCRNFVEEITKKETIEEETTN